MVTYLVLFTHMKVFLFVCLFFTWVFRRYVKADLVKKPILGFPQEAVSLVVWVSGPPISRTSLWVILLWVIINLKFSSPVPVVFTLHSLKPSPSPNNSYWLCVKSLISENFTSRRPWRQTWQVRKRGQMVQNLAGGPQSRIRRVYQSLLQSGVKACFFFLLLLLLCVCQRSLWMFSSLSFCNKAKLIGVWEIKITPAGLLSLPETAGIAQRSEVISGSCRVANIQSP